MGFIPKKINLLYIEDQELMHDVVSKFLQMTCTTFNITTRKSLAEGIEYINNETEKIDVILLDLYLPNSKGTSTFKKLHKVVGIKYPIVIVSEHEDIACKCVTLGAQDYLIKEDLTTALLFRSLKYSIERTKVKNQLVESNNKYIELVGTTKACIYEFDLHTKRFTYVNRNLIELIGYTKEEILSESVSNLFTKESLDLFIDRVNKLRKGEYITQTVEYQMKCKDGTLIWVLNTSNFHEDKNHDIIKVVGVAINITEQKLAQQVLKDKERLAFEYLSDKIQEWDEELKNKDLQNQLYLKTINQQILTL